MITVFDDIFIIDINDTSDDKAWRITCKGEMCTVAAFQLEGCKVNNWLHAVMQQCNHASQLKSQKLTIFHLG